MPTRVRSHAKINLGLAIGPTRPDGFHALTTIYQTLAIHDFVDVTAVALPSGSPSEITISCTEKFVPCDDRNTCWKIVERAMQRLKLAARVTIHIDKKLPVQGGLGTGSANAVAALTGLENALRDRPVGIGHNQPPSGLDEVEATDDRPESIAKELREELEKQEPRIALAKRLMRQLGSGLNITAKWVGRKLDIMFDEAAKTGGKAVGIAVVAAEPHIRAIIAEAWTAAMHWLQLATSLF